MAYRGISGEQFHGSRVATDEACGQKRNGFIFVNQSVHKNKSVPFSVVPFSVGASGLGSAETHVKDFMIRHQEMLKLGDENVSILKILRDKGL